jgi:hypothetical protein
MFQPVLLSIIVVFGIWTSYTDLKKGVIKNYSVLLLIMTAIFLNIFFIKTFVTNPLTSGINIILAVIVGVLLWLAGLWSAADAKLFIAFSFLLPILFFSILVNSFVPLFIFFFFHTIFKTSFKEKKEIFIAVVKPKFILSILVAILALMFISYEISHIFKISVNYFLTTILFFLIFWLIEQKFKLKLNYFYIVVVILSIVFLHKIIFTLSFFMNWIISSCIILILYSLILLSRFVYTQSVKLTELKEGMIIAEMIFKRGGKYFKRPIAFFTLLTMLRERVKANPVFGYNPDGIKREDIKKIFNLYREKKLDFNEIKVCKTTHFAPFLFLGVLLTYFAKGYFIYLFF